MMRGWSTIGCVVGLAMVFSAASAVAQPRWGRPSMPRDGACFYRDQNYEGEYFCTDAGRDIASLPRGMNNEITSIRTFGNVQVTIYRDERFKGRSTELRGDVRNVGDKWNDRISSVRVIRGSERDYTRYRGSDRDGRDGRWSEQQAEAMVAQAYRRVFGRDPDPASRQWVDQVQRNHWTEQQLMDELRRTPEYLKQHSRERR